MKIMKKIISFALAAALLSGIVSLPVQAATKYNYSVHTISAGAAVSTLDSDWASATRHVYQFKVPADGYITLSVTAGPEYGTSIYLSNKKECGDYDNALFDEYVARGKKSTFKVALLKGTYYLYCSQPSTVQYTFKKLSVGNNYSAAKATKLAANKSTTVITAGNKKYGHWYKITLKSAKKLTYTVEKGSRGHEIYVYNADHKYVTSNFFTSKGGKQSTIKTLKKGTYYLYVPMSNWTMYSDMFTFKWK